MAYTIQTTWVCSNCKVTQTVAQPEPTYEHGYASSGLRWNLAKPLGWDGHLCKDCNKAVQDALKEGEAIGRKLQEEALERRAGYRD